MPVEGVGEDEAVHEGDSMTSRDPSRGMHVFFMGVRIRTFSQYSRGM